ncbi:polycystin-1-like protein 1 [Engraulis encrasicolus]|uniref:polycystin-1-like protein 1 n=1 Tax=Engraulis encrasicolus TaxID=184585 RepID=UPI002FD2EAC9
MAQGIREPAYTEYLWDFGGSKSVRTTSRTMIKKFHVPRRYSVTVRAFSGPATSVVSEVHNVTVQRAVKAAKLRFRSSVLVNTTVDFKCPVSAGTDVSYLWSFGDGTARHGQMTQPHTFDRLGEFLVTVTVHNLVSSASLMGTVFVTRKPCLPPPVKNMGPKKIQVQRYQAVRLAVTYDAPLECVESQGLRYQWTLYRADGQDMRLSPEDTDRQDLELPPYSLHYGLYRAVCKVQLIGSVVYSNYSVSVEVLPSNPISIIRGATNLFISRHDNSIITLDGSRSHDPDYPQSNLSYSWHCKPVSTHQGECLPGHVSTSLAELSFSVASDINPSFDQFRFTLTVESGGRSSSSEAFLTITPSSMRSLQIHCGHCGEGNAVNWNEQFVAEALFDKDTFVPKDVFVHWNLYIINGTSNIVSEVPFCSAVDLGAPAKILESSQPPEGALEALAETPSPLHDPDAPVSSLNSLDDSDQITSFSDAFDVSPMSPLDTHAPLILHDSGSGVPAESHSDLSSTEDLGGYGGPTGVGLGWSDGDGDGDGDGGLMSEDADPGADAEESYLMDSKRPSPVAMETTLLDLNRELVDPQLLESYTVAGMSPSVIALKPYSLALNTRYMLSATAREGETVVGRSQLFFSTRGGPEGSACLIQPSHGQEILTTFSVFCASGQEELLYEFSYSVGERPPVVLYEGRDLQHYFHLPSGDHQQDYEENKYGVTTRPCAAPVKVLPIFQRESASTYAPEQHLFTLSTRNLSSLVQTGSVRDIQNYARLLTSVLRRLSRGTAPSPQPLSHAHSTLVDTLCQLTTRDEVTLQSAKMVAKHIQGMSSRLTNQQLSGDARSLEINLLTATVTLLSHILEVTHQFAEAGIDLTSDIIRMITERLLPIVGFADMELYNCTTWRKIRVLQLERPLSVEWPSRPRDAILVEGESFSLQSSGVNVHRFNVTAALLSQAVLVTLRFTWPANRTFPIMLLFRVSESPTPDVYSIKKIHRWNQEALHIFIPPSRLLDIGTGYMSILNADYDKPLGRKYIAPMVNYTLRMESVSCLSWDGASQWTSRGCSPQASPASNTVICSCSHLSTFTATYQTVQSCVDFVDASEFIKPINSQAPYWVIGLSLVAFALMALMCRRADADIGHHGGLGSAPLVLPDCGPFDGQLYAVTVETGLRSPARMTAKVYMVLCGEEGTSDTKELHIPDRKLFGRNSKHTFILSTAESLGPVWMLRLWHDNGGPQPSWYVSRVLVRELQSERTSQRTSGGGRHSSSSWLFLGECWLSAVEDDGKVDRKLMVCRGGLGFWKLLYMKLTDYLEDFHPWLSVYSCAPHNPPSRLQRLSVCLLFQLGLMATTALLIHTYHQHLHPPRCLEQGLSDVSMATGLLAAACVLPVGCVILLLFRFAQLDKHKRSSPSLMKGWSESDISSWEGALAVKFCPTKTLLWIYSLVFSLFASAVVLHPTLAVRARQRARYLRLVRPLNPDELRLTSRRQRKNTLIRRFLSELILYAIVLSLLLFVAYGKSSPNKYHLNQAIKAQLRRGPFKEFQNIRTHQDWWHWTSSIMMEHLYKDALRNNASSRRTNPREGSFTASILVGELILKKTERDINTLCQNNQKWCRPKSCDGTWKTVYLGQSWSAVQASLSDLKSSSWIDEHTCCSVAAQFNLYNPPSHLFSTITLLAEQDPLGRIWPSAGVVSTRLSLSMGALDCGMVTVELLFLVYVLAQLIIQLGCISQNGVACFCSEPRNWIEGSVVLISVLYYAVSAHHFKLKSDTTEQMLREDLNVFIDLETVAFWEQLTVSLHGVIVFIFWLKGLFVLQMNKTMCLPLKALSASLCSLMWPMTAGAILLMALSSMATVLLHHSSPAHSTLLRSVRTVLAFTITPRRLMTWLGLKCASCTSGPLVLACMICVFRMVWTALVKGMVTSLVKTTRLSSCFTLSELSDYMKNQIFVFVGKSGSDQSEDHHPVHTFCLEEFEDLLDELLFKLSAVSDSLHHTLPSKDLGFKSPFSTQSEWSSSFESEVLQDVDTDGLQSPVGQTFTDLRVET